MRKSSKKLLLLTIVFTLLLAPMVVQAKTKTPKFSYNKKATVAYKAELSAALAGSYSGKIRVFKGDFDGDKKGDLLYYTFEKGLGTRQYVLFYKGGELKKIRIDKQYGCYLNIDRFSVYYQPSTHLVATPHTYGNTAGTNYDFYLYYSVTPASPSIVNHSSSSTGYVKSGFVKSEGVWITKSKLGKYVKNINK